MATTTQWIHWRSSRETATLRRAVIRWWKATVWATNRGECTFWMLITSSARKMASVNAWNSRYLAARNASKAPNHYAKIDIISFGEICNFVQHKIAAFRSSAISTHIFGQTICNYTWNTCSANLHPTNHSFAYSSSFLWTKIRKLPHNAFFCIGITLFNNVYHSSLCKPVCVRANCCWYIMHNASCINI